MRKFYFHVRRGQITVLDQEGVELDNTARAEAEATRRADVLTRHDHTDKGRIVVADENWLTLFEVPF
jgi:hypothetical protein